MYFRGTALLGQTLRHQRWAWAVAAADRSPRLMPRAARPGLHSAADPLHPMAHSRLAACLQPQAAAPAPPRLRASSSGHPQVSTRSRSVAASHSRAQHSRLRFLQLRRLHTTARRAPSRLRSQALRPTAISRRSTSTPSTTKFPRARS